MINRYNYNKWLIGLSLLVISVVMWVLNYLTPIFSDDYWYPYMFIGDFFDINRPIESFRDILVSQYNHYFGFNGRSVVHTIVQLFAGIFGKPVFNVFNAIAFAVFVYLLTRTTSKVNVVNIIFTCAVIFFLFPEFHHTVLWMSGSVNYLWTSTVVCLFIILFERLRTEELRAKHFLWLILSIIAGWTNEGITFPLAISLVIYSIINYKTICHQAVWPLIIGFVIGALFCAFAPSTIGRAGLAGGNILVLLLYKIYNGLILCTKLKAIWVLLLTLLIVYFIKKKDFQIWFKSFYLENMILWNAMLLSFGVLLIAGIKEGRVGIGVELFAIILWLRLLPIFKQEFLMVIKSTYCMALMIVYGLVLSYSIQNYQVLLRTVPNEYDLFLLEDQRYPQLIDQYVLRICDLYDSGVLQHNNGINAFVAIAQNRSKVAFFPKGMYEDIVNGSDRLYDIGKQSDYPFYIVPIDEDIKELKPRCILSPVDYSEYPFYFRLIKYFPNVERMCLFSECETHPDWYTLSIAGRNYLIVKKANLYDKRLEAILLN